MKPFCILFGTTALATTLAACGVADDPVAIETADGSTIVVDDADVLVVDDNTNEVAEVVAEVVAEISPDGYCTGLGPQTPRDISNVVGTNAMTFPVATKPEALNLCNIHTHTNAEHKGPGFSIATKGKGDYGGYQCNATPDLTAAELAAYDGMDYGKVIPGDTIEVHWVHSSCDVEPGATLGACLTDGCDDPLLRVETQVFLVVNDRDAADFMDMVDASNDTGVYQASMIPNDTGKPVVFRGSTTGPSYDNKGVCSPLKVTWSVRPDCMKLDIASLDAWAESDNVYAETKSHGVRPLVTDARLLSPIDN